MKDTIPPNNKGCIKTQASKFINRKEKFAYISGNKALNHFEISTLLFHESKDTTLTKKNTNAVCKKSTLKEGAI